MPKRRDNMLEALRASADEALEARRQELARPPSVPDEAPARASQRPPRELQPPSEFEEEPGVTLPMGFASFLLLQVVLLALVFAMGFVIGRGDDADEPARGATRRAGGEVLLDDPDGGRLEGGGDPVRAAPGGSAVATPAAGRRPADIAIESAENRVTVMVSQYNDTGYGRDRARDAFAYLASKGYPVVTPRKRNGLIMLFVGAAPSVAELKPLQGELESLRGPQDQPNYFRSPFIVNIDDYL